MRIHGLEMTDWKMFKKNTDIILNNNLNIFVGGHQTGKTNIYNALRESLNKDVPGFKTDVMDKSMLDKYSELIFLDITKLPSK